MEVEICSFQGWAEARFTDVRPGVPFAIEASLFKEDGGTAGGGGVGQHTAGTELTVAFYDPARVEASSLSTPVRFPLQSDQTLRTTVRFEEDAALATEYVLEAKCSEQGMLDLTLIDASENSPEGTGQEVITSANSPRYFTELSVHGYRGFADKARLELAQPNGKPGSGLTILVGANNSGKSTFIEGLHYVARARHQYQQSFPQPRRNASSEFVEIGLTNSDGTGVSVRSLQAGGSQASARWTPEGAVVQHFELHVTPSRRVFNPYFSTHGNDDRDWNQHDSEFSRTDSRDGFTARLQAVNSDPAKREVFNGLLETIVGEPLDWVIDEMTSHQQYIKLTNHATGAWHTSEGLGEGLVSLLFIVDALYDSQPGSLIAIDEPELSLHPQLVKRLRMVLAEFAKHRQIVIATHSPLLVDWGDIENGALVARTYKDEQGASQLAQPSRQILSEVAKLGRPRNTRNPHVVGPQAREAFFLEDGIILTEGQDDVAYMPFVLADLGLPATENLFGWGAGGARNIPKLAQLFLELGFKRIGAILDADMPTVVDELNALENGKVLARMIPAPDIRYKEAGCKPEVVGLLAKNKRTVRAEFREEAYEAIKSVFDHVSPPHVPSLKAE